MSAKHHGPGSVAHLDEHRLLQSLSEGRLEATSELVRRVVSDCWQLAVVVQGRVDLADDLTVRAINRTLADAADGHLPPGVSFRAAALRATRDESLHRRLSLSDGHDLSGDPVLATFGQLAEPGRSALYVADIILLPDDQIGDPLELSQDQARRLADRAGEALRQRLARRLDGELEGDALRDALVGAVDQLRAALPTPPEHLDEKVFKARAAVLTGRRLDTEDAIQPSTSVIGRLAAAGPPARRTVAAAAAAVLVAGLASLGAASGGHRTTATTQLAGATTQPRVTVTGNSPTFDPLTGTSTPTGVADLPGVPGMPDAPGAPASAADEAAVTNQLLDTLTNAATTASIPGTAPASGGSGVQSTNVGSPTPANPANPTPPATSPGPTPTTRGTPTTQAPSPSTTAPVPTTTAPVPTTNPLQPVIDLLGKVVHP